jgi:hypothetical protein
VQHGSGVLSTECSPDLRQGSLGQVLSQVHGDLTRVSEDDRVFLGLDLYQTEAKLRGNESLYHLDGDRGDLRVDQARQHLLGIRQGDRGANERRISYEAAQRTFKLSDVNPELMETVLTLIRTIPYLLRRSFQDATQSLPPSPGGRPRELLPEQCKEICLRIGQLYGVGVEVRDAQKRMAQRYGVSLRTIQRAWQERAKWNSHSLQENT